MAGGTLTRRQMMKLGAGVLLAANAWPGRVWGAESATRPLKFVVVNDLHFAEAACVPFFEGLVKQFNELEPAHVLFAGDLLDTGTAAQAGSLKEILRGLKMPWYAVPGNHDWATQTDRTAWKETFEDKGNQFFEVNGWQFVGLDTSDGVKYERVSALKPTLDFVASLPGKLDKAKPTFVFTHFPLGPGVRYELVNAAALLEPFKGVNLQAIFNGHFHAFTQKSVLEGAIVTTNRCCSRKRANHDNTFQKGFFVVEAAEGKFGRRFVEYGTDFPGGLQVNRPRPATLPGNVPASQPAF